MTRKYILFFSLLISALFYGCSEDDNYQTRMEDERNERGRYLKENGITKEHLLEDGIYYQELLTPENSAEAKKVEVGDDVVIYYTGYFLNGMVFDTNVLAGKYEPMTVRVLNKYSGQEIQRGVAYRPIEVDGWIPALLQMQEGTKARVVIPSNLAYRIYGNPNMGIPGYTTLVYEIEVAEVRKAN